MNETFLFLIAVPLGAYLIVILFQTREFGSSEILEQNAPETAEGLAHENALEVERVAVNENVLLESNLMDEEVAAPSANDVMPTAIAERVSAPLVENETVVEIETAPTIDLARVDETTSAPALQESIAEIKTESPEAMPMTESPIAANENAPALSEIDSLELGESEPILPEGPLELPEKGSPKYAFDYRGRLWIEKKRKSFFRQLRRPQLPPDDPQSNSSR